MCKRVSALGMALIAICIFLVLPETGMAQRVQGGPRESPDLLVRFASSHSLGLSAEAALERFNGNPAIPENANLRAMAGGPIDARFLIKTRRSQEALRALPAGHPSVELHRWLVVRYPTVQAARAALRLMQANRSVFAGVARQYTDDAFSVSPSDPQYGYSETVLNSNPPTAGTSSAAAHSLLGLPTAWDLVTGFAYVAVLDNGIDAPRTAPQNPPDVHPDLAGNLRVHFSRNTREPTTPNDIDEALISGSWRGHGTHVAGIVAATPNNAEGTSGACWKCSLMAMRITNVDNYTCGSAVDAINEAISNGAQVINLSLGLHNACPDSDHDNDPSTVFPRVLSNTAIALAELHEISVVAASGNIPDLVVDSTQYPASHPYVVSVGATSATGIRTVWLSAPDKVDFAAPGDRVFSTFYHDAQWHPTGYTGEGHPGTACVSQGGALADYGYCTGTSMSSPMIAGSIGVVRSANPLLSQNQVRNSLAAHANRFGDTVTNVGSGVPNVGQTVQDVLYASGGNLGVTPLFVMYSSGLNNYFYSVIPQMASAASAGTLRHGTTGYNNTGLGFVYAPATNVGSAISGYTAFPGDGSGNAPVAAVNVFTTTSRLGQSLVPLYRLSWSNNAGAVNHAYTTEVAGISAFESVGFALDGIEGYIYPNSIAQPAGTVKLYRKHHPTLDRYVLFPENQYNHFIGQGFTGTVGSEWIGYVCPNPLPNTGVCPGSSAFPTITTASSTTFQVGVASSFGVSGTGTPIPSFSLSGALPDGVTFTQGTGSGMLSGTPAAGTAGSYPVTITATNSVGTATQNFTLTVIPAGESTPPQFRSSSALNGSGTLGFPAGSVSTDWLVMYVVSTATFPTPAGWTLSRSYTWSSGFGYFSYLFTRQVGAATNVSISTTNGGALIAAYQNVSGVGAIGTFAESTGTSVAANSITTQHPNSAVVGIASDRDPVNPTAPASFASRSSFAMTYFGNNIADRFYGSAGATGSASWTQSSSAWPAVAVLIELLPASSYAPTITSANSASFQVGLNGSFTVTATGSPTPSLSLSGALPAGVTFNPSNGILSGTPAAGTAGLYPVTMTATNSVGTVTQNFTLTVDPAVESTPPQFRSSSALNGSGTLAFPAGSVSTDWLVMYLVSAGTVPTPAGWTLSRSYTWSSSYGYSSYVFTRQVGIATNVTISTNNGGAIIAAYQNVSGVGAIGVFAESAGNATSVAANSITTQHASSAVVGIASDRDPVNPTAPASFTSRSLFAMTYFGNNIADRFYGSAGATGSVSWIQSNSAGSWAAVAVLIELLPVSNSAPTITSANSASFQVGVTGSFTVTATGSPVPSLSLSGALPAGVTFNPSNGILSGTPAAGTAGSYPVTITATNSAGTATQNFTLTVTQPVPPQFRSSSALDGSGTLGFPAGSVSTDWLVMYVVSTATFPTPAGWTLSRSYTWSSGYGYFSYVFTRQVGAATNVTISTTNGGALIAAYQNVSGVGAIGTFAESTGTSVAANSITTQHPNSVVVGVASDRDPVNPTAPASFTSRSSFAMTYFGNNIADRFYGSAGATGSTSWTQSASPGSWPAVAILIELLP